MTSAHATVSAAIDTWRSAMDANGMFPEGLPCGRCGKELNAGGLYPAELYAGTFNGLCYPCTSAPCYLEKVSTLDDAQHWSYAPETPSWRRDRRTYIGYEGCETCGGRGRHLDPTTRRYSYCRPCAERNEQHPLRQQVWNLRRDAHVAAQAAYEELLIREAFPRRKVPKGDKARGKLVVEAVEVVGEERHKAIQAECLDRWRQVERAVDPLADVAFGTRAP